MDRYDKAWMSAIWGRFGAALWSILALAGITISGNLQADTMEQGFRLIQSGWEFAGQAGAFISAVLAIISKVRESKK